MNMRGLVTASVVAVGLTGGLARGDVWRTTQLAARAYFTDPNGNPAPSSAVDPVFATMSVWAGSVQLPCNNPPALWSDADSNTAVAPASLNISASACAVFSQAGANTRNLPSELNPNRASSSSAFGFCGCGWRVLSGAGGGYVAEYEIHEPVIMFSLASVDVDSDLECPVFAALCADIGSGGPGSSSFSGNQPRQIMVYVLGSETYVYGTMIDPVSGNQQFIGFDPSEIQPNGQGASTTIQTAIAPGAGSVNVRTALVTVRFDETTFDANADGDTDCADLLALRQAVSANPSNPVGPDLSIILDFDGDNDLDTEDLVILQAVLNATDACLTGDVDQDGVLSVCDIVALRAALLGGTLKDTDAGYIVNGDIDINGGLDNDDVAALADLLNKEVGLLHGDVNGNYQVDSADLSVVLGNFGSTSATRAQGDLNGDGSVDSADLSLVLGNFGRGTAQDSLCS